MLTASRANLVAALAFASSIVERRNTIPILSNVLIQRGEDGLALRMTDLDVELHLDIAANFQPDFRGFTVPAHLLHEIVRKLPDGAECLLEPADANMNSIRLKSGRSRFSLQVLPEADFPHSIADGGQASFEVTSKTFGDALAAVSFAISTEETRYYLNGVYCHPHEDGLMLVATDGHRLAKRFVRLGRAPDGMPSVIIPRKTVGVLPKLLPKDGKIRVDVSDAKITFNMEGRRLSSKLVDGTFPDYQRVVPRSETKPVEIDGKALKASVDRVSTIATERSRGMKFIFQDEQLTLSVANPDAGSSEETLPFGGELTLETGFNARYVLDAINNLPDGTILLAATDAGSPAVLRADGDHEQNLIVLMPMRV